MGNDNFGVAVVGFVGVISLIIGCLSAWLTHVITCITAAKYIFLMAGGLCAPIGVVHGIGIWFGIW